MSQTNLVELDEVALEAVSGGLKIEGMRLSDNVINTSIVCTDFAWGGYGYWSGQDGAAFADWYFTIGQETNGGPLFTTGEP